MQVRGELAAYAAEARDHSIAMGVGAGGECLGLLRLDDSALAVPPGLFSTRLVELSALARMYAAQAAGTKTAAQVAAVEAQMDF